MDYFKIDRTVEPSCGQKIWSFHVVIPSNNLLFSYREETVVANFLKLMFDELLV